MVFLAPSSVLFLLLKRFACACACVYAVLVDSEAQVVKTRFWGPSADAFGCTWWSACSWAASVWGPVLGRRCATNCGFSSKTWFPMIYDIAMGWYGKSTGLECLETWLPALAGGTFDFGTKRHYRLQRHHTSLCAHELCMRGLGNWKISNFNFSKMPQFLIDGSISCSNSLF